MREANDHWGRPLNCEYERCERARREFRVGPLSCRANPSQKLVRRILSMNVESERAMHGESVRQADTPIHAFDWPVQL